jgi:DNA-directed RNA polymerase specialized sigma24 family protein
MDKAYNCGVTLETALARTRSGLSVLPILLDGSKAPDSDRLRRSGLAYGKWGSLMERPAEDGMLAKWFDGGCGIGTICGKVSGDLIVLDFDVPGLFGWFFKACDAKGLLDLIDSLPFETTPRGGVHLYLRVPGHDLGREEPAWSDGKATIEVKGNGCYVVSSPTPGYRMIRLDLTSIPRVDLAAFETLYDIARAFNHDHSLGRDYAARHRWTDRSVKSRLRGVTTQPEEGGNATSVPGLEMGAVRRCDGLTLVPPGDDFNARGDVPALLRRAGWFPVRVHEDGELWRRPGKSNGHSGIWFPKNRLFHCFSSNALPLEAGKTYDPFGLYTALRHEGDYSAAARDLYRRGFGRSWGRGRYVFRNPDWRKGRPLSRAECHRLFDECSSLIEEAANSLAERLGLPAGTGAADDDADRQILGIGRDDLLSTAAAVAWEALAGYRVSGDQDDSAILSHVRIRTYKRLLSAFRWAFREQGIDVERPGFRRAAGAPDPRTVEEEEWFGEVAVRWAVERLSPRQKEVVRLHLLEEHTWDHVAMKTGRSVRTVRGNAALAIESLRRDLG